MGLGGIHVTALPDASAVAKEASLIIMKALRRKPDLILCAASGTSPLGTYEELARAYAQSPDLFRTIRVVKLDEWGGLARDDPATCESYVRRRVIEPLQISEDRYLGMKSDSPDPLMECARIRKAVRQWSPIDISVLGIGLNGHLGLNEPGSLLEPFCHVAELSETAKAHGMLKGSGAAPKFGMTLGMGELLQSRTILLIALGETKRAPIERALAGPITTEFPASFLTLHPDVQVVVDAEACPAALVE